MLSLLRRRSIHAKQWRCLLQALPPEGAAASFPSMPRHSERHGDAAAQAPYMGAPPVGRPSSSLQHVAVVATAAY